MKIHFVCTGNTFRSRLAEAYLKSKLIPNLEVSSSGINASKNASGEISPYTIEILKEQNIFQFASKTWVQTTGELLEKQDLVIFMQKIHFEYCTHLLSHRINNCDTWDIRDVSPQNIGKHDEVLAEAKEIFEEIKNSIDNNLNVITDQQLNARN